MKKSLLSLLLLIIPVFAFSQSNRYCTTKTSSATINIHDVHPGSTTIYQDLDINASAAIGISLTRCSNIHITRCFIHGNNTHFAIQVDNCSNIQIDTVYMINVSDGVRVVNCTSGEVTVNNNRGYNINDPLIEKNGTGHCIQFSQCSKGSGTAFEAKYNRFDNPVGPGGLNPRPYIGDFISCYQSSGVSIIGNAMRNGGSGQGSKTQSDGISIGDGTGTNAGSDCYVANDTCVNTGYAGIQCVGGQNQTVINCIVYSDLLPYSALGIQSANFTIGAGITSSTISGNRVNWAAGLFPPYRDLVYKSPSNPLPTGWASNVIDRTLSASVLPVNMMPDCNSLVFGPLPTKTYGDSNFAPGATSGSAITYTSSNTAVATIVSGNIHITGSGTSTITANDGVTTIPQTLTVNKKALTITANNKDKQHGQPNPPLTASYSGFISGEDHTVLTAQPVLSTSATMSSPVGRYDINISGATAINYSITFLKGTLTIHRYGLGIRAKRIIIVTH